eukprot:863279-Pyramimonas_sp.AAC.1
MQHSDGRMRGARRPWERRECEAPHSDEHRRGAGRGASSEATRHPPPVTNGHCPIDWLNRLLYETPPGGPARWGCESRRTT